MKFTYQATDRVGETVRGEMEAPNKERVFELLVGKGLTPIVIKEETAPKAKRGGLSMSIGGGGLSAIDKILFAKRLTAVLKAGIPIVESLDILITDSKEGRLKTVLVELKTGLERGESLAAGFSRFPKDFSPVFIGLIKAGEDSGTLTQTLETITLNLKKEYEVKRNIRAAMFYPAILLASSGFIVIVMITFVLPRITVAFEQSGVEMPLVTRMMLALSHFVVGNPARTLILFLGFVATFIFLLVSKPGQKILGKIMARLPVISSVIKQMALSRFSRVFASLLKSGVPVLESLDITATSIGSETYEREIRVAQENVRKGIAIADSFRGKPNLFPTVLISMIAIGEKSGTLDETLGTLAEFYDEEVDRLIKNALTLIEPIMLLVMGLVVGGIAVSILLPIYKLVSGFA